MTSPKGFALAAWLALAALVLIAGGAYVYTQRTAPEEAMTNDDAMMDASGSMTVQELIAKGQDLSCTFSFDGGGTADTTGTVYVSNGKVRGDYTTVASGQTFVSHVIVRDNAANIWMDGSQDGFTSTLSGQVTTGGNSAAPDINSKLDYDCAPWTPDETKFALPVTVTFKAVSAVPTPS